MPGDFSRFSDNAKKRFSALFMQQGRVQLDADWNESVEILRRRTRLLTKDVFGPAAVPRATTPNGFQIGYTGGTATDISIAPGRIYVDGLLAEYFADETFSYLSQPFLPPPPSPFAPPALSTFGVGTNVLVYLDVWEQEITAVEDGTIVDKALNGVDTGTRFKTIWQVKVTSLANSCVSDFSQIPQFASSGGRLTTSLVPPAQAPDPCSLPAAGGYQGVDNRLYRVVVHDVTNPMSPLFKWSRDNGSVASTATAITNQSATATIVVSTIGRDDDLSFHVNDWVEVTDDWHEWTGQPGLMARITIVDAANRILTVDRSLAAGNFDAHGANGLRVRRWDQPTSSTSANTGLVATGAAPVALENGILVQLSAGPFHVGDTWVFAVRVSDGQIDVPLTNAPPIAIQHHYCSLGTIQGLNGTAPVVTDCRVLGDGCCCTECVTADEHNSGTFTIQEALSRLALRGGGVLCLSAGTFNITATITITEVVTQFGKKFTVLGGDNIEIRGAGPATQLLSSVPTAISVFSVNNVSISDLAISCSPQPTPTPPAFPGMVVGINASGVNDLSIERCYITATDNGFGVGINLVSSVTQVNIRDNHIKADYGIGGFILTDSVPSNPANDQTNVFAIAVSIRENDIWGGIAFYGANNSFDEFVIDGNTIAPGSGQACISLYGTAPNAAARISGNAMGVNGAATRGIDLGCDDTIVSDNYIALGTTSSIGINIGPATHGGLVRCYVERNQVTGGATGIMGIFLNAAASRITIRNNTISTVEAGIYASATASAVDQVIEGNECVNIGTNDTSVTLPFGAAGILAVDATRLIIRGNTLSTVGPAFTNAAANAKPLVTGIYSVQPAASLSLASFAIITPGPLLSFPSSLVISNNEISALSSSPGSALSLATPLRMVGIFLSGGFDRARVSENRINLVTTATTPLSFMGVSVQGGAGIGGQQDADVSNNAIDAVLSTVALLQVIVQGACLLRANSVAILGTNTPTSPATPPNEIGIQVNANTLVATDNQVNVYGFLATISPLSGWGMQFTVTRVSPFTNNQPSATILGNISTTGIGVGGWITSAGTVQAMVPLTTVAFQLATNVVS